MERVDATVRHKGLLTSSVQRYGLTPAEVVILQRIHGTDAVVDAKESLQGRSKLSHAEELNRINEFYGIDNKALAMIADAFPGHAPKLPTKFEEIGLTVDKNVVAKSKVKPASTPAAVQEVTAEAPNPLQ